MSEFAQGFAAPIAADRTDGLHRMMSALRERVTYEAERTDVDETAAAAFDVSGSVRLAAGAAPRSSANCTAAGLRGGGRRGGLVLCENLIPQDAHQPRLKARGCNLHRHPSGWA